MLYRQILFFYSVFISLVTLVWIILYQPTSVNFIFLILFLPVALHFFLGIVIRKKHTNEKAVEQKNTQKVRGRIFVIVFFIILLTIFTSSFSILIFTLTQSLTKSNNLEEEKNAPTEEELFKISENIQNLEAQVNDISFQLEDIKNEISSQKSPPQALGISGLDTLDTSSTDSAGFVQVTQSGSSVNVYESNSTSSKVLGTAEYKKIYPFSKKSKNWYLIFLQSEKEGWVQSQFVKEL